MGHHSLTLLPLALATLLTPPALAQYTPGGTDDLYPTYGIVAAKSSAFDDNTGHLWISAVTQGFQSISEIDPSNGAFISSFVPLGNIQGLTIDPTTGNLFVFRTLAPASIREYTQAGAVVQSIPSPPPVLSAAIDSSGMLYVMPAPVAGSDPVQINRMDKTTGAVLGVHVFPTIPIVFNEPRPHMDFDPVTGHLMLLSPYSGVLYEVDLQTDLVINHSWELWPFYGDGTLDAAFAYNASGDQLFVISWYLGLSHQLTRVNRNADGPVILFCSGNELIGACPCGNNSWDNSHNGCANSTGGGTGARLRAAGSVDVLQDTLQLQVGNSTPGNFGLFFSGTNQVLAPFGDGLRCAGGSLKRLEALQAGGSGASATTVVLSQVEGLVPGDLRNYQWWYRDPAGPCGSGFNLSNAVAVTWQ